MTNSLISMISVYYRIYRINRGSYPLTCAKNLGLCHREKLSFGRSTITKAKKGATVVGIERFDKYETMLQIEQLKHQATVFPSKTTVQITYSKCGKVPDTASVHA